MALVAKVVLMDTETGEIVNMNDNQQGDARTDKQKQRDQRWRRKKNELYTFKSFVWFFYYEEEKLFPNLKPSDVSRLFMLATYLDYDGHLVLSTGKDVTKKDLPRVLKISEGQCNATWKSFVGAGFAREQDGRIFIDEHLFFKGTLAQAKKAGSLPDKRKAMCLSVSAMRDMYRSVPARKHKALWYILQMIPYLNRHNNALCWNCGEDSLDMIEPVSMGDFCEIVGYTRSGAQTLYRELAELTMRNRREPVICRFNNENVPKQMTMLVVNPALFYFDSVNADISDSFYYQRKFPEQNELTASEAFAEPDAAQAAQ